MTKSDKVRPMNLSPAADEITGIVISLQDFINDTFNELEEQEFPTEPKDFTASMHSLFCDYLDAVHSVEKVLEQTVEKISEKYENKYNEEFGLAKVYNIYDYQKTSDYSTDALDAAYFLLSKENHPSNWNGNK